MTLQDFVLTERRSILLFIGIFAASLIIVKSIELKRKKKKCYKYPPAFPSLPFIGSIPWLPRFEEMHTAFMKKRESLGDVFGLYFGNKYTVVIEGYEAINEALSRHSLDYAGRPCLYINSGVFNPNRKGIIDHPFDHEFKKYHQLSLNILKEFGFGKNIMENRIHIEVDELVKHIKDMQGQAVFPHEIIVFSVMNVIVSVIFGERFNRTDPEFHALFQDVHYFVHDSVELVPINMFPPIKNWPSMRKSISKVLSYQTGMLNEIKKKIAVSETGKTGDCFASCFRDIEGQDYDNEQLEFVMRDLLIAGTETSATTLQWALIAMANNMDVQRRAQAEIDSVVARDRLPSLEDRTKLPYVEAVMCELMRRWSPLPLSVSRLTINDTKLMGYDIPKDTVVFANLYSCHMDPKEWKDPEVFNPERFLDENGKVTNKHKVIPFSIGKRSCLGELLARQEIYLFLTGLLQNFEILPPAGQTVVEHEEVVGVTVSPENYHIRLVSRK